MLNVFVSRPTTIEPAYEKAYATFGKYLAAKRIAMRRLGGGDYSRKAPLKAVFELIDECCGAIILGYPQFSMTHEARKSTRYTNHWNIVFPTPWNQIEGALAYRAGTPVLVIAHPGVEGGVFDHGTTGEGVIHLDLSDAKWFQSAEFKQPFKQWLDDVKLCKVPSAKAAR